MAEDLKPRNMKNGDYHALVELWSAFPGNTMTGADGPEGFRKFLEENGEYCFVVESGGRVVGSVMAGEDSRRGYVYHLAVEVSMRGKGIGSGLMGAVEEALRSKGIEKVHLFIYVDNPAIGFYDRIGWHRRTDITVMSKVLIGDEFMGTREERQ